jgi:hypothetical protein
MEYESVTQNSFIWQHYTRRIDVWEKIWRHTSKFQNFLTCIFLGAGLGVIGQFRSLRAHPIIRRLISSCEYTLRTMFTRLLWPPSMNWNSELLLRSKQLHRKCWRTLEGKLNTAWTFYVPRKARILKLFSILQYWFYKQHNFLSFAFIKQFYFVISGLKIIGHGKPRQ